jgi:hypothetical protein
VGAAEAETMLEPLGSDWLKSRSTGVVSAVAGADGPPEMLLLAVAFLVGLVGVWTAGQRRRRGGHLA